MRVAPRLEPRSSPRSSSEPQKQKATGPHCLVRVLSPSPGLLMPCGRRGRLAGRVAAGARLRKAAVRPITCSNWRVRTNTRARAARCARVSCLGPAVAFRARASVRGCAYRAIVPIAMTALENRKAAAPTTHRRAGAGKTSLAPGSCTTAFAHCWVVLLYSCCGGSAEMLLRRLRPARVHSLEPPE